MIGVSVAATSILRYAAHAPHRLIHFLDPAPILDGRFIIVGIPLVATGQLDLVAVALRRLVWDQTEKMRDEVEPGPPFVV